jgi:hypothetical protein
MRTGLGIGVDDDRAGPELLGARASGVDRRGARHPGRLRRVQIELAGMHHANPVEPPIRFP